MGRKQIPSIDYFEQLTTQRNDYKWPKGVKRELALQKKQVEESLLKKKHPVTQMDVETLVPYAPGVHIPFTLQWQRKPILHTNPKQTFKLEFMQEVPKDDNNVRSTRPRVYKAPEISLDDIPDKRIRNMIIDYTYTSTWNNDSLGVARNIVHRNIPNTTWQLPRDEVCFVAKMISLPCEEEWGRKCGKYWDKLQTCYAANTDKIFWQEKQKKQPKIKSMLKESDEFLKHIIELQKEDKLRMPYSIPISGYTGFIPNAPFNIIPEKKCFSPTDCQMSLKEAVERLKSEKMC